MGHLHRGGAITAVLGLLLATVTPAPAVAGRDPRPALRNPISAEFADTFADPVIVRGQDGFWYAYGTTDPLHEGERVFHRIPTARSADLVRWTYVGDAFTADQQPPYAAPGAGFWAPDVRFLDGRYVMYFTVTDTTVSPEGGDFAIGVA
ncbi:family 43 glycosylhydrolase, partial [Micromonospora echinofusca]